jgi:hypothetical protein
MLAMSQLGHSRQNGLSARRPFSPPDSDRTVDTAVCANAPFCTSAAIYFGKSEILLPIRPKSLHNACRPGPHKGAFRDRHERKVGMRWTRAALLTRALFVRVVLNAGVKLSRSKLLGGDGGKKARSPRRVRRKPLKPSRAGMPGDSGATVVTNARVFYTTRAAAGASGTRHSPLPPWGSATPSLGRIVQAQLGRYPRRGNANSVWTVPRLCERSEAIHS